MQPGGLASFVPPPPLVGPGQTLDQLSIAADLVRRETAVSRLHDYLAG
jgi:hypothetical protein